MAGSAELDRQGLEVLPEQECWRRLEQAPLGRVAFVYDRAPLVLPVNHRVHEGHVVFRTTRGSKLDAVRTHPGVPVAFEVDDYDPETRTGWSVVVHGHMDHVVDQSLVARLSGLELRPWAEVVDRDQWLRIAVERISGRRVLPLASEARG